MVQEKYVNFGTAKLLKEKGFDGVCYKVWEKHDNGEPNLVAAPWFVEGETTVNRKSVDAAAKQYAYDYSIDNKVEGFLAPTQSLAMCWLREEKHYYIQIMLDSWALGGHSGYYIVLQDINSDFEEVSPAVNDNDDVFFKTYEEAAEAAIKYVLEKLV